MALLLLGTINAEAELLEGNETGEVVVPTDNSSEGTEQTADEVTEGGDDVTPAGDNSEETTDATTTDDETTEPSTG